MDVQSLSVPQADPQPRCTPLRRKTPAPRLEVAPTLLSHLGECLEPGVGSAEPRTTDHALLDRFVDLLFHRDPEVCHGVVQRLLDRRLAPDQILLELLTPAAQRLGDLWEDDARSFVEVTLATGHLQELLRWIVHRVPAVGASADAPRVLLVTPAGEDHTFGALLFHAVLRFRGWSVVPVAPFWKEVEVSLRDPRVAVLGVSVGSARSVGHARSIIRRARTSAANSRLVVVVGGALAAVDPEAAGQLGADGVAGNAESALELLVDLVPSDLRPSLPA